MPKIARKFKVTGNEGNPLFMKNKTLKCLRSMLSK